MAINDLPDYILENDLTIGFLLDEFGSWACSSSNDETRNLLNDCMSDSLIDNE